MKVTIQASLLLSAVLVLSACGGSSSSRNNTPAPEPVPSLDGSMAGQWRGVIENTDGALRERVIVTSDDSVTLSLLQDEFWPMSDAVAVIAKDAISLHDDAGQTSVMLFAFEQDAALLVDDSFTLGALSRVQSPVAPEALTADSLNGQWLGTALAMTDQGEPLDWPTDSTLANLTRQPATLHCDNRLCELSLDGNVWMTLDFATGKTVPGLVEFDARHGVWDGVEAVTAPAASESRATLLMTADGAFAGGYICPDKASLTLSECVTVALTRAL